MKKFTNQEFVTKLNMLNTNVSPLEEYKTSNQKIKFHCNICGNEWYTSPNIIYECGCPKCSKKNMINKITKTHEKFIEEMNTVNSDIKIISQYKNSSTHVKCKCKICGYIWNTYPSALLLGTGCSKCKKCYKRTQEEFIKELKEVSPNISIIGNYTGVNKKIKYKCLVCGYIGYSIANNLLNGCRCPNCLNGTKLTEKEFLNKLHNINPNIIIISEYQKVHQKVLCKCAICNTTWERQPRSLLSVGSKCPVCEPLSMGENKIRKYLDLYHMSYESQKKFDDLYGVGNGKLSYDFYLPFYNCLIEYQGEQHERPINFSGCEDTKAQKMFIKQKEHDRRKRKYAKNNGYKLLEIWYYDYDNIEEIIKDELSKKNKTSKVYTPTMGDEIKF